jgi:hypothetical protein
MKQCGGGMPVSIRRLLLDPFGSKATRCWWVDRNQRCLAMEEYRRRLERTQLKIYAALLVLLFGGLLMLPRIGQLIWIVVIMAIYIRVLGDIADFGNASQASL